VKEDVEVGERLVVIGGDPGGMAALSQVRRLRPATEIVVFEKGNYTSYSACGIPYVVGGDVEAVSKLISRAPEKFRADGIDVRLRHEVTSIDLDRRAVAVRDLDGATDLRLEFDQLLIGAGGRPIRPKLPGIDNPKVHGVQTLDDADHLLRHATEQCRRVVVVGGGYIGLEMAEAFVKRDADVVLVEGSEQVMHTLDAEMGELVADALRGTGVDLRLGKHVEAFTDDGVVVGGEMIPADLVVLGIGVAPNSELARDAGITLGARDSIHVDRRQQTSAEGVWAAGDCCESFHLVSRQPVHIALGTIANKQSRVAGINIGGGHASFPGVVGTAISKICGTEVARTGLTTAEATAGGFDHCAVTITSTTKAGYFPGAEKMDVRFVVERGSGRLLGAQIVGGAGAAKRIDVCAVALTAEMTVGQIVDLDLAYAPPFAGVWDPVLVAAREAIKLV
jgi:NADPH-dependent 2,4-dienoyl-CoA reductase/sulfur reductase-like enzyme